jgi:hypothetical protein
MAGAQINKAHGSLAKSASQSAKATLPLLERKAARVARYRILWRYRCSTQQVVLTPEHFRTYVPSLFQEGSMVRALTEEAVALASLALFLGMIAIWAQVIATL